MTTTTCSRSWGALFVLLPGVASLLAGCGGGSGASGRIVGFIYTRTGGLTGYLAQPVNRAAANPDPAFILLPDPPDPSQYTSVPNAKMTLTDAAWIAYVEARQEKNPQFPPAAPAATTLTDADGGYTFTDLAAGQYRLTVETGRGPVTVAEPVTVYPGHTARGTETPSGAPADLVPRFSLLGTATFGPTYAPVVAATVSLRDTGYSMVTGPDGAYGFGGLGEGYYFLDVTKDGFPAQDFYLTVVAGETTYGPFTPIPPTENNTYDSYTTTTSSSFTSSPPPSYTGSETAGSTYDPSSEGDTTGTEDDVGDTLGQPILHPHVPVKR